MRYILTFLLGALLLILLGLALGYLSLDLSAPPERQLTAAGALAYLFCYAEDDCTWQEEYGDEPGPGEPLELEDLPPGTILFPDENGDLPAGPFYMGDPVPLTDEWRDLVPADEIPYDAWGNPLYEWEEWNSGRDDGGWSTIIVEDPWYVQAFPGIGRMVQQIIPGAQNSRPIVRPNPSPAPPPRVVYPQPSCWISAQPMSVSYGGSSVLQWSSFNATQASLSDVGQVPTSGSHTVRSLTGERIYSLSVSGQGGSGSCYTRITVQSPSSAVPSCIISANPGTISSGQTANLAWGSNNASSALLSGVGAVATQGGMYVAPRQTTAYTLTVFGSSGRSNTCSAQVGVLP